MAFDNSLPPGPVYHGADLALGKQDLDTEVATWIPGSGWRVTRDFVTENARWRDELPADFEEHPDYPGARFVRAVARQKGKVATVRFLWEPRLEHEDGDPTLEGCPPDEITENGGILQQPITQHPKFLTTWAEFWNFKRGEFSDDKGALQKNLVGVQTYDAGSFTVSHTQYFGAKPATVMNDINQLVDPPGHSSSGGLQQWKISTGSVNLAGICWAKTLVYEYNESGWNPEIYD